MRRRIARLIAGAVAAALVLVYAAYSRDMHRASARISGKSTVIPSPYGEIEYTEGGSGPDVLVVHGSGGGWDQGELVAQAALGDEFHRIVPSRFGYLRSTFHEGATFDDQAHAYACLLDHLGIEKVAVVALSHGGPSALLFAVLHPDRVSSLTLISCGVASAVSGDQAAANQKGNALVTIYQHNPLYWGLTKAFRKQFMGLMGANDAVVAGLSPEQRRMANQVIDFMNPVAPRSAGVIFDNRAKMPNERIAAIKAPTLVLHARDDGLQLYRNAEFAAANIPGARLVSFDRGGHLLMVVEQAAIAAATQEHILAHVEKAE